MPLSKSGNKMLSSFRGRYGQKLGTQRFYATANKLGIRTKVDPGAKGRLNKHGRRVRRRSKS